MTMEDEREDGRIMSDTTRLLAQAIRRARPDCPARYSDAGVVAWFNDQSYDDILARERMTRAQKLRQAISVIMDADPAELIELNPLTAPEHLARLRAVIEKIAKIQQEYDMLGE